MKDIAERTGLSVNTVSLALRDSPRIPPDTRNRVRLAASALDYTPNHSAKALTSRRTSTVGLLLTDLANPLLMQVACCVEQELKALGYVALLAASNDDPKEELRALATFRGRQVDGMLAYPLHHGHVEAFQRLRARGMPVVLLAGEGGGEVDVVCLDERDGARRATQHLLDAGHRRISLIDGSHRHGNPAKGMGFSDALRAAGVAVAPELVIDPMGRSLRHGYDAFAQMMALPDPPTAALASNDRLALGGLRWCQERGLRVPEDLAIFGYDDVEYAAFASPPLSSVNYPAGDLARRSVARLMALIGSREALPQPELIRIQPELVLRESTDRPR